METVSPGVIDKPKLKQILGEDEGLRNTFIDDEKVSRRLINENSTCPRSSGLFMRTFRKRRNHSISSQNIISVINDTDFLDKGRSFLSQSDKDESHS